MHWFYNSVRLGIAITHFIQALRKPVPYNSLLIALSISLPGQLNTRKLTTSLPNACSFPGYSTDILCSQLSLSRGWSACGRTHHASPDDPSMPEPIHLEGMCSLNQEVCLRTEGAGFLQGIGPHIGSFNARRKSHSNADQGNGAGLRA